MRAGVLVYEDDCPKMPSHWNNQGRRFDALYRVDESFHKVFDALLDATYIAKATQDRACPTGACPKTPGGCQCVQAYPPDLVEDLPEQIIGLPTSYRVREVIRIEDSEMWSEYVADRNKIRRKRVDENVEPFDPPLLTSPTVELQKDLFVPLDKDTNEAYLFHG